LTCVCVTNCKIKLYYDSFLRNETNKRLITIFTFKPQKKGFLIINLGLNKFFIPINITNFDFSPYKIKLNVFIFIKKFILFFVLKRYNFDVFLTFFEQNMNI